MKLFFREHALLIAVQLLQFGMILAIFWLDGYRSLWPALYSVFIGLFLLACYLLYHYYSRKKYYEFLNKPLDTWDSSFQKIGDAPVAEALEQLLQMQFRLYQHKLDSLQHQQEQHLAFMNQWVHHMKTPLSIIELTIQSIDEPELSSIREEIERMSGGLTTILYMARLRSFEQDFHIKPVRLSNVVREVLHENKRLFIRNQIYPEFHDHTTGLSVESDEKWLFFILLQLINNGIKYSAVKGKTNEKLIISSYLREQQAVLEVRDNGIGIPVTDIKRVFDPFFTGDNGRKLREATGMGLYLSKEAADHLGHLMELESAVGKGTTVRLIFTSYQTLH
ncbi:sensor histidine kinase [Paenibacillus sp. MMS20-IR301]|uniref:sensor histidine kinase n=1 Tax=Paenibacillus sp. MMS20-IR301 TaxID=2895946 RepID=UPI0028EE4254|nr:sensor histidine kinase [Paenibacillus sp. MMS20-IR301]WNS41180.1 sensor histidine kinase [Paenibacillus sp. MMS20-IR301]